MYTLISAQARFPGVAGGTCTSQRLNPGSMGPWDSGSAEPSVSSSTMRTAAAIFKALEASEFLGWSVSYPWNPHRPQRLPVSFGGMEVYDMHIMCSSFRNSGEHLNSNC